MAPPRRLFSAVGATQESARAQISALGPVAPGIVPLLNQVPTWNGSAYEPMAGSSPSPGSGGVNFIFDSTGNPPDPARNVYTDFAELCAVLDTLPQGAQPVITFLGSTTLPSVGMPATGWRMYLGSWKSAVLATGSVIVDIPDGVLIDSLSILEEGIAVRVAPTSDGVFNWNWISGIAPGVPWVFSIGLGACLNNVGSAAAIVGPGTGQYIVLGIQSATFGVIGLDTAPFVKADLPDVVISSQTLSGFYGSLPNDWLEGSAFLFPQNGVDTRDAVNSAWTGAVAATAQSKVAPRAQTTARKILTFTDEPPPPPPFLPDPDKFTDWSLLMGVYSEISDPVDISLYQSTPGIPLICPAGTWQLKKSTRFVSSRELGREAQLQLSDGCVLRPGRLRRNRGGRRCPRR